MWSAIDTRITTTASRISDVVRTMGIGFTITWQKGHAQENKSNDEINAQVRKKYLRESKIL